MYSDKCQMSLVINFLSSFELSDDEDGPAGGEKMVMVAARNPSKCLWTLKLLPAPRQAKLYLP